MTLKVSVLGPERHLTSGSPIKISVEGLSGGGLMRERLAPTEALQLG